MDIKKELARISFQFVITVIILLVSFIVANNMVLSKTGDKAMIAIGFSVIIGVCLEAIAFVCRKIFK